MELHLRSLFFPYKQFMEPDYMKELLWDRFLTYFGEYGAIKITQELSISSRGKKQPLGTGLFYYIQEEGALISVMPPLLQGLYIGDETLYGDYLGLGVGSNMFESAEALVKIIPKRLEMEPIKSVEPFTLERYVEEFNRIYLMALFINTSMTEL